MPDQAEFLRLLLSHQREIGAFVAAAVRDTHVRDDIVQQTALALWRTFDRYDRTRPFDCWARGIARNIIRQHYRKSARDPVLLKPEALDAVMQAFDETREEDPGLYPEALRHCVEKAPPKSQQLLELRYRMSLSMADIAKRLRTTQGAVNQALCRIRRALRTCIEGRLRILAQQGEC
jgi:RNA polymerase sigma-70 factor (ECF subfamily)